MGERERERVGRLYWRAASALLHLCAELAYTRRCLVVCSTYIVATAGSRLCLVYSALSFGPLSLSMCVRSV